MSPPSDSLVRSVVSALVEDEGVDTLTATAAVDAVRGQGVDGGALSLYRAARRLLRDRDRPSDVRSLHETTTPESVRRPPPRRRGTSPDTPAAKRRS